MNVTNTQIHTMLSRLKSDRTRLFFIFLLKVILLLKLIAKFICYTQRKKAPELSINREEEKNEKKKRVEAKLKVNLTKRTSQTCARVGSRTNARSVCVEEVDE